MSKTTSAATRHDRPSNDFEAKLAHAVAVLSTAASDHAGAVVQATSLGAEDMVLTDLIARHGLAIRVATLDTGVLHAETLALLPRIESRYGIVVDVHRPRADAVIEFVQRHGERAMFESIELRKSCCGVRKLEPLSRMLQGQTAWLAAQAGERAEVPFSERDGQGRVKFNPLADWTWGDVWHHIATQDVPYNPLHDQFFPSIGCAPCTRAIALGEDFRAGRWWWEQEGAKECGLHVKTDEGATA
jgi:phosphoadenosine phosphosulfate reductase